MAARPPAAGRSCGRRSTSRRASRSHLEQWWSNNWADVIYILLETIMGLQLTPRLTGRRFAPPIQPWMLAGGKLSPVVAKTYPLGQVAEAIRELAEGNRIFRVESSLRRRSWSNRCFELKCGSIEQPLLRRLRAHRPGRGSGVRAAPGQGGRFAVRAVLGGFIRRR